jgi:hypothetical protein
MSAREERDPVPVRIRDAERWRLAGEKLHAQDPGLFQRVFMMLVAANIPESEDEPETITESSILT